MLILITIALEVIFSIVLYFTHWVYKSEDHLVWCNDFEIIEALQGEQRTSYIQQSSNVTKRLIYKLMIASLILCLPISTNISFPILFISMLCISIYYLIVCDKLSSGILLDYDQV